MIKRKVKKIIEKTKRDIIGSNCILMFHRIQKDKPIKNGCDMHFDLFCESLEKTGNFTDIRTALQFENINKNVITFDDSTDDIYSIVYPYLAEKNLPFTVFVIPSMLDKEGYITTEQLKLISENDLVTIGSHGFSHKDLKGMPYEEQKRELIESKILLENIIGRKVDLFAYPHGQSDNNTIKLLRTEKIYNYCFNASGGSVTRFNNNYTIPRLRMDNKSYNMSMALIGKG